MQLDLKQVLKQVRKIEIVNRILVSSTLAGAYRSSFKGQGMEFADVREYVEGDDVRNIDWNITARLSVPHVKQFEEEREMTVLVIVDASRSTDFGTVNRIKRQLAVEFCASMAFSAIKNNDRVGLLMFTDKIEHFIPANKGKSHIMRVIRDMIAFDPQSNKTDVNCALEFLTHIVKKKSTVFLVSDFYSDIDFEENLRRANFRHDINVLVLTDRREREIPNVGIVELEDPESGRRVIIDTGSKKARRRFKELAQKHRESLDTIFTRCHVDSTDLDTAQSYVDAIVAFFKRRQGRKW
ncbi:DUF58 domain-containing protein [candidate division FCPU426 bacterium]|nr:DUF58 domain-containing protein [candidate division FCPU426 bacterium]